GRRAAPDGADRRHRKTVGTRRTRPRGRAAGRSHECETFLTPLHSQTALARVSMTGETRPSNVEARDQCGTRGGTTMTQRLMSLRTLLLAGACSGLLAALPAVAQQPAAPAAAPPAAAAPAPTPSWAVGRPQDPAAVKLAPVAPLPIPTAMDKLPLDKL